MPIGAEARSAGGGPMSVRLHHTRPASTRGDAAAAARVATAASPSGGPAWRTQKERGSALLMAVIVRIALALGRPAAGLLLHPICAYFVAFSPAARRASRGYLVRVLGRPPRWRDVLRHYHCFAATILDRVFVHAGRMDCFDCSIEGVEVLRRHIDAGRGCLLFGAHFGNFDMLRAIAVAECPVPVRVLMHHTHAEKMSGVMRRLNADLPAQVIALGQPRAMLEARDALSDGALVALLADRSMHGDRDVECAFLGAPAGFPRGPFELAAMLDAPVVLFSATYRGGRRYEIRFEDLDEPHDTAAAGRDALVECRTRTFAAWLEARCRGAPYNWFNFYDFWSRAETERAG